jgi:hypothetical protein
MSRVVIGMDPHKRSATIEVIDDREKVLAQGRYGTDTVGYQEMLAAGRRFADRVWAIEGCGAIGRHWTGSCSAPGRRRRAGPGCTREAVRPGAGVRHRAGP